MAEKRTRRRFTAEFKAQAVQRVPVEALPGPPAVVQAEVEQGEDGLVDPVGVDLHGAGLTTWAAWHPLARSYRLGSVNQRRRGPQRTHTSRLLTIVGEHVIYVRVIGPDGGRLTT